MANKIHRCIHTQRESLLSKDKGSLLHVISDIGGYRRILIDDGMIVVNQITKASEIKI